MFFDKNIFDILQLASISDSCATYVCEKSEEDYYDDYPDQTSNSKEVEEGYKMVFHICVCPNKTALKEDINTKFQDPKIEQCCPKTYITNLDTNEDAKKLECPGNQASQPNQDLRTCKEDFKDEIWQPHMFNGSHFKLNGEDLQMASEQFCIGQAPKIFESDSEFNYEFNSEPDLIHHTLFHCSSPCTVGKPCLR